MDGFLVARVRVQNPQTFFTQLLKGRRWLTSSQLASSLSAQIGDLLPSALVIRTSDGTIRWMDVSEYLKKATEGSKKPVKQVIFKGDPLTALNILRLRDKLLGPPPPLS